MALTELNKSKGGVESILAKSSYAVDEFELVFDKQVRITELKDQMKELIKKEDALFAALGGYDKFLKKLEKFQQDAQYFRGRKLGLNFTWAYDTQSDRTWRKVQQDFVKYLVPKLAAIYHKEASQLTADDLFNFLNLTKESWTGLITEKGTTIKRSGGQVGYKDNTRRNESLSTFLVKQASPAVRQRIKEEAIPFFKKYGIDLEGVDVSFSGSEIDITTVGATWFSLTGGHTASQAKKMKYYQTHLNYINEQLKIQVKEALGMNKNKSWSQAYDAVIEHMLSTTKDPWLFFVGRNTAQITGLIGEICAMVLFYDLVGHFPSLEWAAENKNLDGGQISVDIIIYDGYGIQVKNSVEDLFELENIANQAFHVSTASFEKLGNTFGFDGFAIEDLYSTLNYNASYKWESKEKSRSNVFYPGLNINFDDLYNDLTSLRNRFEHTISYYGSNLLYMDDITELGHNIYSSEAGREMGNVLYMMNLRVYRASDILKHIIEELETTNDKDKGISTLNIGTTMPGVSKTKHIYDDINVNPHNFFSSAGTENMSLGKKIYMTTSLNITK